MNRLIKDKVALNPGDIVLYCGMELRVIKRLKCGQYFCRRLSDNEVYINGINNLKKVQSEAKDE